MQNLGFLFSIWPALYKIYPDRKDLEPALSRHLEYYNSHPYMASFVLGAVVKMEEEHAQGKDLPVEDIILLKKAMMGPMGALGDSFFWASLRPTLAIFCAALALSGCIWSPFIFLTLYNIPHLYVKFYGFYQGYKLDKGVGEQIRRYNLFKFSQHLKSFTLIMLGAMVPIVIKSNNEILRGGWVFLFNLGTFLTIIALAEILRRKVSVNKLLLIISSICILLGLLNII